MYHIGCVKTERFVLIVEIPIAIRVHRVIGWRWRRWHVQQPPVRRCVGFASRCNRVYSVAVGTAS